MIQNTSLDSILLRYDLDTFSKELGFESYDSLANLIYRTPYFMQYRSFFITKRNGDDRRISAPKKGLKDLQRKLLKLLETFYSPPKSVHAYTNERSVVSNAENHVGKKFVFSIDLKDFFNSIHFGRVRNLFTSHPYCFSTKVATVIAHICCKDNVLPQGAPTSPLISNMICWKLDRQLLTLASKNRLTYTRYADDITLSSTIKLNKLSRKIAIIKDSSVEVGAEVQKIIETNGFKVNVDKVRVRTQSDRMEVTGLTVNEKINVSNKFYKQVRSMLYAWGKFGYENAEKEHHSKFYKKHRPSGSLPALKNILYGKLLYMGRVKGLDDKRYVECAKLFNQYCEDSKLKLKFDDTSYMRWEYLKTEAMFVLEFCYDGDDGLCIGQGTGFYVPEVGLVTCEHALPEEDDIDGLTCHAQSDVDTKYRVKVVGRFKHHDLAICKIYKNEKEVVPRSGFELAVCSPQDNSDIMLLGFPNYKQRATTSIIEGKIASHYRKSGLSYFESSFQIRGGYSGGPVLDKDRKVIGIALKGARQDYGENAVLYVDEIRKQLSSLES